MKRDGIDTKQIFKDALAYFGLDDDGAKGKAFEISLKTYKNPNALNNNKVTKSNVRYADTTYSNKAQGYNKVKIEIKSGCGELGITDHVDDLDSLLKNADYIVYAPEINDSIPMEKQGFVFSRNEFMSFITGYTGRGQLLRTKEATTGGSRVSLQSFYSNSRPKASKKLADYIWDACYEMPTFEQWLNS